MGFLRKNIDFFCKESLYHVAKKRFSLSAEDKELFRAAVADVTPIAHDRAEPVVQAPWPEPRQREIDDQLVLEELLKGHWPIDWRLEGGDELAFRRPGISFAILRDLRRGRWVIQEELDLHGATREKAHILLVHFLAWCLKHDLRCVRVIHGKGKGSPGREPVLKKMVANWLAHRQEVLAFCQAKPQDGGAGALVVLLRASHLVHHFPHPYDP